MKILFVTHWANNMLIFRADLLKILVERGHDVFVLCPNDFESIEFEKLGVKHISWGLKRGGGFVNLLYSSIYAVKVLRRIQPDKTIVYCIQPILAILFAKKISLYKGELFTVFTGLGSLWTDITSPSLQKRIIRGIVESIFALLLPRSKKVFVLNKDDLKQVLSWSPKRLKDKVFKANGEGVDSNYFCPLGEAEKNKLRAKWEIPENAIVLGFVGRLIQEKGAQDFLQLCRLLKNEKNMHFLVVGSPDKGNPSSLNAKEVNELKNICNLHFKHWMKDVRPAYGIMNALVFLSAREGLPISPLEAMSMNVPVLAYDAIGTREVVPKSTLVQAGDVKGIYKLVKKIPIEFEIQKKWEKAEVNKNWLNLLGIDF